MRHQVYLIHVYIRIKVEGRGVVVGCDPQDHDVVKEPQCWEASYSNRRGSARGAVDGLQKAALPPPRLRVPPWREKIEATAQGSAEQTYHVRTYVSHLTASWSKDTVREGKGEILGAS